MFDTGGAHPDPAYANPLLVDPEQGLPDRVAVIGAGTVGPDIGYFFKFNRPDIDLVLVDILEEALGEAEAHIDGLVDKALTYDKLDEDAADSVRDIEYTTTYDDIAGADIVIEAVTEDLDRKRDVVQAVEAIVDDACLVASNTSSLPAERIFADANRPERTTVTHFFAPAWQNPIVEVVTWEELQKQKLDYLYWLFGTLGKLPLVVEDEIAFALDRVFNNWCNESAKLLDRATAAEVDTIAGEFVAAGPFSVLNLANGNPVIAKSNAYLAEENDAYAPAHIFKSVSEWKTSDPDEVDTVSEDIREQVLTHILGVLLSQATNIADREIATRADLSVGCEAALAFDEGPFDVMRTLGTRETNRILADYSASRPGMPMPNHDPETYQDFYRHIVVDERDNVDIITIRRPHEGNILTQDAFDEIRSVFQTRGEDVGGFVLTGHGLEAFSSGMKIDGFLDVLGDHEASRTYARECSDLFDHMELMETPIVAAVNGRALGAGLELVMRCHGIVAMEETYFQFPEVGLGILPGIGGAVVPYRRWGKAVAPTVHDMLRFADPLSTTQAAEYGMVDRLAGSYAELVEAATDRVTSLGPRVEPLADRLDNPVEIEQPEPSEDPVAADGRTLDPDVDRILCETIGTAARAASYREALEAGYSGFAETACTPAAEERISAFLEG